MPLYNCVLYRQIFFQWKWVYKFLLWYLGHITKHSKWPHRQFASLWPPCRYWIELFFPLVLLSRQCVLPQHTAGSTNGHKIGFWTAWEHDLNSRWSAVTVSEGLESGGEERICHVASMSDWSHMVCVQGDLSSSLAYWCFRCNIYILFLFNIFCLNFQIRLHYSSVSLSLLPFSPPLPITSP